MSDLMKNLGALISSLTLAFLLVVLFHWFHLYDWGHAFFKAVFYACMLILIIGLWKVRKKLSLGQWVYKTEFAGFTVLSLYALISYGTNYFPEIMQESRVDHSYLTTVASDVFWKDFKNPYESPDASPKMLPWSEQEGVSGFSNGPFLLAGYVLSAKMGGTGLKLSNLAYFFLTLFLIVLIVNQFNVSAPVWEKLSGVSFAVFVFLMSERYWYEVFTQGAIDIFPVLLILISMYFGMRDQWFLAGLFGGLSLSAKIIPAAVYLFLFVRKDLKPQFVLGASLGFVPFVAFMAWSPEAFLTNSIFNHAIKGYDSTSLYSIMPEDLHFLFAVIKIAAAVAFLVINFNRKLDIPLIIRDFLVLMIIIEVTFTEVHGNHLMWFVPFLAIVFSWVRHDMLFRAKSILTEMRAPDRTDGSTGK